MAGGRPRRTVKRSDQPVYAKTIEAIVALSQKRDATPSQLSGLFAELTGQLESSQFCALAFVAETASHSCLLSPLDPEKLGPTVIDLCERLLNAANTLTPFEFDNASPELMSMLFPDPECSPGGGDEHASEVSEGPDSFGALESISPPEQCSSSGCDPNTTVCPCSDFELLKEFLDEAGEHATNAEQLMLTLEETPRDEESIHGLFRAIHSLKGASGVCELHSLGQLAHFAESLLVKVRDGELSLDRERFTIVLLAVDFINRQLRALREAFYTNQALRYPLPPEELLQCLEETSRTGRCDVDRVKRLKASLAPEDVATQRDESSKRSTTTTNDSLRVDGGRLELLVDLIGELVIAEAFVQRELMQAGTISAASVSSRLRKVVRDVQQLSLTLKMVSMGSLFKKLNRLIRDLSEQLAKPIRVVIEGADTEVDKTLLEAIADPLIHIIRNSVDHGIESNPQLRVAQGKPEVATIRLRAEHRAGSVHVTVSDDGRGLDRDRILARAIQRGLVSPNDRLTETDIDKLIFSPGFSTAETVSELSGRGVGMDVVRRNVEAMRGVIRLSTQPGLGTTIRLELPLTLSIIDGTVIRVGAQSFVLPTLSILEQLAADEIELMKSPAGQLVRYRGEYISVIDLESVLEVDSSSPAKFGKVCIVVETGGTSYGLLVDQIHCQQPVVIKPLGNILSDFSHFAGGAFLSTGEIAFVLDVASVCLSASLVKRPTGMESCVL